MNNQQPLHFQFQPVAAIGGQPAQLVYTCCMGCRLSNGTRPFYNCWRYEDSDEEEEEEEDDDYDIQYMGDKPMK